MKASTLTRDLNIFSVLRATYTRLHFSAPETPYDTIHTMHTKAGKCMTAITAAQAAKLQSSRSKQ